MDTNPLPKSKKKKLLKKIAQRDRDWIDAMFANGKLTEEDISSISGVPVDEIQKRRAQH